MLFLEAVTQCVLSGDGVTLVQCWWSVKGKDVLKELPLVQTFGLNDHQVISLNLKGKIRQDKAVNIMLDF